MPASSNASWSLQPGQSPAAALAPSCACSRAPSLACQRPGEHREPVEQGVDGDARPQRAGALVDPGQREPQGEQRHEDVELQVRDAEDGRRDAGARDPPPRGRETAEQKAAEEDLLEEGRQHHREDHEEDDAGGGARELADDGLLPGVHDQVVQKAHQVDGGERHGDGPEEGLARGGETPESELAARDAQREEPRRERLPAVDDEGAHDEGDGGAEGHLVDVRGGAHPERGRVEQDLWAEAHHKACQAETPAPAGALVRRRGWRREWWAGLRPARLRRPGHSAVRRRVRRRHGRAPGRRRPFRRLALVVVLLLDGSLLSAPSPSWSTIGRGAAARHPDRFTSPRGEGRYPWVFSTAPNVPGTRYI